MLKAGSQIFCCTDAYIYMSKNNGSAQPLSRIPRQKVIWGVPSKFIRFISMKHIFFLLDDCDNWESFTDGEKFLKTKKKL